MMHEQSHDFLKRLLATPSPSGFEQPIQAIVREWAAPLADEVRTDRHGNVLAIRRAKGVENPQRVMLAGHCDQIGLMVQHIDETGFLYVQPIGGWDLQILLGQHLTIWTRGGPIAGVLSRKAIHLLSPEERKKVPEYTDMWIDIGATERAQTAELVEIGDPVTLELGYRPLLNDQAASPAMDDKVGLWTVMETLRLLEGRELRADVYCVSTVQEEVGLRGAATSAYGIDPTVGIAVDVCHATDTPGSDKKKVGDLKLGSGPVLFRGANVNPRVLDKLQETARAKEIPFQPCGAPRATGTDANTMQLAREGVAAALIGIPNRYMHSPVETVSLLDLEHAARLLAEFCSSITEEDSWIP